MQHKSVSLHSVSPQNLHGIRWENISSETYFLLICKADFLVYGSSRKNAEGLNPSFGCHYEGRKDSRMRIVAVVATYNYKPLGTRTRGMPKLRWNNCGEDNLKNYYELLTGELSPSGDRIGRRFW
ncbi:hypothetical protein CEXT_39471 [Caerostris extrusa]|uniref:Uncharacterized protein n=1 Tax=Caerostris extrusa TaxID=172846 RepID=A0AAV4PFW0_CAEEX|nr:hypothetical protein CEXT_39471 [Caerostris extrusa]